MTSCLKLLKKRNHFTLKKEEFTEKTGLILVGISLVIIFLTMSLYVIYIQQKRLGEFNSKGFALTGMVTDYSLKRSEENGPIGALFGKTNNKTQKTESIVLITPYIISADHTEILEKDTQKVNETEKKVQKERSLKELIPGI